MNRTPIIPDRDAIPSLFHPLLNCPIFDSSSHSDNRVWFLDTDGREDVEEELLRLIAALEVFQ